MHHLNISVSRVPKTHRSIRLHFCRYAQCAEIVRQFAQRNPGHSSNLRVTMSHCEDTETETDCFVGCAFGDKNGGTYRFLLPEIDNRFTKPRCKLSIHPRCACGNARASPPAMFPPPPPRTYTEEWNIVQSPFVDQNGVAYDTSRGVVNAMAQRLVNGRTLDMSLRAGPMHLYEVRYTRATFSFSQNSTLMPTPYVSFTVSRRG